jgi:hypothetical protein
MKRFHAMPAVAQLRRLQNALEEHAPGVPATLKDVHEALQRLCAANTERYRQLDAAAVNGTLKATPLVGGSSPTSDGDYVATPPSMSTSPPNALSSTRVAAPTAEAPRSEPLTFFHSRVVPTMSLWSLAKALDQHTSCGEECLLIALVLFSRFCEVANLLPTAHMMHRLYVACLQVGLKAHSDRFPSNKSLARIAGITLQEMNRLEQSLVHGMDWNVQVRRNQVEAAIRKIMNAGGDAKQDTHSAAAMKSDVGVDYDVSSAMSVLHHERSAQPSPNRSRNASADFLAQEKDIQCCST